MCEKVTWESIKVKVYFFGGSRREVLAFSGVCRRAVRESAELSVMREKRPIDLLGFLGETETKIWWT